MVHTPAYENWFGEAETLSFKVTRETESWTRLCQSKNEDLETVLLLHADVGRDKLIELDSLKIQCSMQPFRTASHGASFIMIAEAATSGIRSMSVRS